MTPELQQFINDYTFSANIRNVSYENSIRFTLQPDHRIFTFVVGFVEPSFSQMPYNVLWLCIDPNDPEFKGNVWRRVNHESSSLPSHKDKKYTWELITSYEMLFDTDQYYQAIDETPSYVVGTSWGEIGEATVNKSGLVLVNQDQGANPVVVETNDPRMFDKRVPKTHTHSDFPRTMIHITGVYQEDENYADRVNDDEVFVSIDYSKRPSKNALFFLTHNNPDRPNEWYGEWRVPTDADIVRELPNIVSANIRTPDGEIAIADNQTYMLAADSLYSDSSTIVGDSSAIWSIDPNAHNVVIDPLTGQLVVPDLTEDVVVTIRVSTTDIYDDQRNAQGVLDLTLRNLYVPINLVSIEIIGADSVNEKNQSTYQVQALLSNGQKQIVDAKTFTSADIAVGSITVDGTFDAKDIDADTPVDITATYEFNGVEKTATKSVLVIAEVTPIRIRIRGTDTMNELTSTNLDVEVEYSDGSTAIIKTADVNWTFVQSATGVSVTQNENNVTFTSTVELDADETFTVQAEATVDGIVFTDTHDVTVKDITVPPVLQTLQIIGSDTIDELSTGEQYSFQATYDNGASVIVNADSGSFSVDNVVDASVNEDQLDGNGNIILGTLDSITDLTSDKTVVLSASYTENGNTVNATKNVLIVAAPAKPVSMAIFGATEMNELSAVELSAEVTMDDGSRLIASGTDSIHNLVWSFDQTATGITFNDKATVREFVSETDLAADETFIVRAQVTIEGVQVSATHSVTVKDVPLIPTSLEIIGKTNVDENSSETYTFQVTWSDGFQTNPANVDLANADNALVTFGTDGSATIGEFSSDETVVLSAMFEHNGTQVNATKNINVADIPVPQSLEIVGATEVDENDSATYVFRVTMSDTTTKDITPDSATTSDTGISTFGTDGAFTSSEVSADTVVQLSASYTESGVTLNDTHDVTIKEIPKPVSIEIIGATSVNEGASASYRFEVTMSDATTKDVTALTADATVGTLSNSGLFNAPATVTSDTASTLSVSYEENGVTVSDSHNITIVNSQNNPVSLEIAGANAVNEDGTPINLVATVTYEDSTTATVTVGSNWTVQSGNAGGSIDNAGVFTPSTSVTSDTAVVVQAAYTENGVTVTDTHNINVVNSKKVLTSLVITGATTVLEGGNVVNLVATANYDDSSSEVVTSTSSWSLTAGIGGGNVNNSGVFTSANDVGSDTVSTVRASFTHDGVTMTDTHDITVQDIPVPQSIQITGATEIDEGSLTTNLGAVVTLTDSTTQVVTTQATWSILSGTAGTIDQNGVFTSANDVASDETVTVRVSYSADGVTVTDDHIITVKDVSVVPTTFTPRWGTVGPNTGGSVNSPRSVSDYNADFMNALTNSLTGTDGETFQYVGGTDSRSNGSFFSYDQDLIFIAYPADLGWLKINDNNNNFGAFDGATDLANESGVHNESDGGSINIGQFQFNGGIRVTIDGNDYIIYRQDSANDVETLTMTLNYGAAARNSGS